MPNTYRISVATVLKIPVRCAKVLAPRGGPGRGRRWVAFSSQGVDRMTNSIDPTCSGGSGDIERMSNGDLMDAIHALESTYKRSQGQATQDHRRHFRRRELLTVYHLAKRRAWMER